RLADVGVERIRNLRQSAGGGKDKQSDESKDFHEHVSREIELRNCGKSYVLPFDNHAFKKIPVASRLSRRNIAEAEARDPVSKNNDTSGTLFRAIPSSARRERLSSPAGCFAGAALMRDRSGAMF